MPKYIMMHVKIGCTRNPNYYEQGGGLDTSEERTQIVIRKELELNLEEVSMKNTNKYEYFYI